MSSLRPIEKRMLSDHLESANGDVLDFTSQTFGDFFRESAGVNIYDVTYGEFGDSMAERLRAYWKLEKNDSLVATVIEELDEFWLYLQQNNICQEEWARHQAILEIAKRLKTTALNNKRANSSVVSAPAIELGRGGFGVVHQVEVNGNLFAKKTFQPTGRNISVSSLEKLKARFEREIRAQQSLEEGIAIPILDFSVEDDPPWFLMPVAEASLTNQLEQDKSVETIIPILMQVLEALEKLHISGRVHRDLAPSNIFKLDGKWLLGDLGLVSPADEDASVTSSISIWGHKGFSAPELSQQYKRATARADIYSFGCILHEIFVGSQRFPFHQQTGPGAIGRVIEKCTEIQPRDRYQTIAEIRQALEFVFSLNREDKVDDYDLYIAAAKELASHQAGNKADLAKILAFLTSSPEIGSKWNDLLENLSLSSFGAYASFDPSGFSKFASIYSQWIDSRCQDRTGFSFGFCDLLGERLRECYWFLEERKRVEVVRATFRLGVSHNRWHVLGIAREMIGSRISDDLATLVGLELVSEQFHEDLLSASSEQSGLEYHPIVARHLRQLAKKKGDP